jgi:pyruvyltransferase
LRHPKAADIALGDPALLSSRYFKKSWRKKYRLGIVPHYVDKGHELTEFAKKNKDVLLIDVFDAPEKVLKQISSCRAVVSSSSHGIIVAHSYGVPAAWVELSDEVAGSGFKFRDYYSVFNRRPDSVTVDQVRNGVFEDLVWTPSDSQLRSLLRPLERALTNHYENL